MRIEKPDLNRPCLAGASGLIEHFADSHDKPCLFQALAGRGIGGRFPRLNLATGKLVKPGAINGIIRPPADEKLSTARGGESADDGDRDTDRHGETASRIESSRRPGEPMML